MGPLWAGRVQCPGRVCAAFAAGSGGSARCLVSCLPRFPLLAPRVLRCVWQAVPSGCPLPSLSGTPFHAVCAFDGLGPVCLLVFPACPLCVCALALPRRPRPPPPPPLVGVARAPHTVPALGAGRAVPRGPCPSTCPAPVPRSVWFVFFGRGGGPVPFPRYLARGCVLPVGWVCASGAFQRRGVGLGGGAACAPVPSNVRPGGPVGRAVALPRSVPLPSLGRQQSGCPWRRFGHGGRGPHTALVRARLLSPGPVRVAPWCGGVGSLVHLGSCGSRRLGRGGGSCSGLPPGRRGPAGGRGDHPLCPRGVGAGAPMACGPVGGVQGQGGGRAVAPHPPGGGGLRPSSQSPFCRRRIPPRCTRWVGVVGQPRAPGAACCRRGGGGEGAARERPPRRAGQGARGPGGRAASVRPSALPGRATLRELLATLRPWGARPPYCFRANGPPKAVATWSWVSRVTSSTQYCRNFPNLW